MHGSTASLSVATRPTRSALTLLLVLAAVLAAMLASFLPFVGALGVFPSSFLLLRGPDSRSRLARRILAVAPIALSAVAVRIACTHGATAVTVLGIATTREALVVGGGLALRVGVAALWTTWLTTALAPSEIDRGLLRLAVPAELVTLFALTRRFAAQLTTSLNAAWAAIALRGGFLSWRVLAPSAGLLAGVIVVRALDRSHRVGIALALRGGVG